MWRIAKRLVMTCTVCVVAAWAADLAARPTTLSPRPASIAASSPASVELPIRRVLLYSTGVAFVERRGRVSGDVEVRLPLRASQVDDVLKSLLVLDLGQGHFGPLRYESPAPQAPSEIPFSIAALTEDGASPAGLAAALQQLQGVRVLVSDGSREAIGEVLTVERQPQHVEGKAAEEGEAQRWTAFVVLAGEQGDLTRFDLARVRRLRVLDLDARRSLHDFTRQAAATRRRSAKTIAITARGRPGRELVVSYTTAAPVWKMTYRAALDTSGVPFLQGWAIVDNTSEEDWRGVKLSLVSGSPVSFVQHLQQPLFRHRPVLPLPRDLAVWPQPLGPLDTSRDWGDSDYGSVGGVAGGIEDGMAGGIVAGALAEVPPPRAPVETDRPTTTFSDILASSNAGVESMARPVVAGDLFDYRVEAPVSIARDESALIPIVQTRLEGERVAIWREGQRSDKRPLAALRLRNTTGLVLEGGPITILDGDVLAGEAVLERIKPAEEQLVTYALDLDTLVESRTEEGRRPAFLVKACEGSFEAHYHRTRTTTWTLTNQADHARVLYLEQRHEEKWELTEDGPSPIESDGDMWRFRVELTPKSRIEVAVTQQLALLDRYQLGSLSQANLQHFEEEGLLDAETKAALEGILALRARIKHLDDRSAAAEREIAELTTDQTRIRENMRAMGPDRRARNLVLRWVAHADAQETRLQTLQAERRSLAAEIAIAKADLAHAVQSLSIERRL